MNYDDMPLPDEEADRISDRTPQTEKESWAEPTRGTAEQAASEPAGMVWTDTREIDVDLSPAPFGRSYEFDGLKHLREEACGRVGNYVIWPSNGRWSLFRDTHGDLAFEKFENAEAAKTAAAEWDLSE